MHFVCEKLSSVWLSLLLAVAISMGVTAQAQTIVIDAGHGGHDCGARGVKVLEKDINLAVALRVGKMLQKELKDAKVVYTRSDDRFIPLQGRCDIANRVKGDIFISIHTNSVAESSPNRKTVAGASVYTLGLDRAGTNLDVAMRENSVMKLENDYTAKYSGFDPNSAESYIIFELNQSVHLDCSLKLASAIQNQLVSHAGRRNLGVRQAPFWVLVRTSMPAVLVELDFVCNPDVESYLGSEKGRDELAEAIFKGICSYLKSPSASVGSVVGSPRDKKNTSAGQPEPKHSEASDDQPAASSVSPIIYKVQFLTSPRSIPQDDPRLKGLKDVESYKDGGSVKLTVGSFASQAEAQKFLRDVKKKFPDAFIIKTRDGKRIP